MRYLPRNELRHRHVGGPAPRTAPLRSPARTVQDGVATHTVTEAPASPDQPLQGRSKRSCWRKHQGEVRHMGLYRLSSPSLTSWWRHSQGPPNLIPGDPRTTATSKPGVSRLAPQPGAQKGVRLMVRLPPDHALRTASSLVVRNAANACPVVILVTSSRTRFRCHRFRAPRS